MYKFGSGFYVLFIYFLSLSVWTTTAEDVKYLVCPREEGTPVRNCSIHGVRIAPCPMAADSKPCDVKKGKSISMEIDYTVDASDVSTVEAQAYWATTLADLPLVGMDTDGCKYTTCPLKTGQQSTLTFNLNISKKFPARGYDVKFKFWKEDTFECCIITKIKILSK